MPLSLRPSPQEHLMSEAEHLRSPNLLSYLMTAKPVESTLPAESPGTRTFTQVFPDRQPFLLPSEALQQRKDMHESDSWVLQQLP